MRMPATAAVHGFHYEIEVGVLRLESECGVKVCAPSVPGTRGTLQAFAISLAPALLPNTASWAGVGPTNAMPAASQAGEVLLEEAVAQVKRCCASVNCCLNDRLGVEIRGSANTR